MPHFQDVPPWSNEQAKDWVELPTQAKPFWLFAWNKTPRGGFADLQSYHATEADAIRAGERHLSTASKWAEAQVVDVRNRMLCWSETK